MRTERVKMLVGEFYDPMDAELVAGRGRARGLCQALNATREAGQDERRRILGDLFWSGGDTVLVQPPFPCEAGGVVTRDVPEGVFTAGNPCRVIRPITEGVG